MQIIRGTAELDAKIEECNRAEAISDDAMRALFGTFRMDPPEGLPADPMSAHYRDVQMALYRQVAGRDYATANEVTAFDIEAAVRRPFPFSTRSATTAGEHFLAIGYLMRAMALPPGSRIVEFGPGWGNTTMLLARLGYQVTVVDIEANFCELIRRRAVLEGVEVEVVQDDFFWAERCGQRFDAALFFECFHHCDDHLRLLRALHHAVVRGGRLVFGAEPISDAFTMPWGLRLDGNSLWAIRKNGWLELGFREDYFAQALAATGWRGTRQASADLGWLTIWQAQRSDTAIFDAAGHDPRLQTQTGQRTADGIAIGAGPAGTALFGPYLALPRGRYVARIGFGGATPVTGRARMDVSADAGHRVVAERDLPASGDATVTLPFTLEEAAGAVEVRLFCEADFTGLITSVAILAA